GVVVVFFFQAEDGIRDWSVTGVQTCALPISDATGEVISQLCDRSISRAFLTVLSRSSASSSASAGRDETTHSAAAALASTAWKRSEERRVGKEVRGGWEREG